MRPIDADWFKSSMLDEPTEWMTEEQCVQFRAMIDLAPTVDAVPVVHGRWQWISSTYDRIPCEKRYWCSKCHHETITHDSEPWEKFCPHCGAKMDGKDGDYEKVD